MSHDPGREIIGKFFSLSLFLFNLINIDFVFLFFRISNRVLREEKKREL